MFLLFVCLLFDRGNCLFGFHLAWLGFVNLMQARVIWEEETSAERTPPSGWPVGESVGQVFDLHWYRSIHPYGWPSTPGQMPASQGDLAIKSARPGLERLS